MFVWSTEWIRVADLALLMPKVIINGLKCPSSFTRLHNSLDLIQCQTSISSPETFIINILLFVFLHQQTSFFTITFYFKSENMFNARDLPWTVFFFLVVDLKYELDNIIVYSVINNNIFFRSWRCTYSDFEQMIWDFLEGRLWVSCNDLSYQGFACENPSKSYFLVYMFFFCACVTFYWRIL